MLSIADYQDYHLFIADYYAYKKRTSAFTWREFAKQAGFSSPIYLKQVSEGKYNLGDEAIKRVAQAMDLVGYEVDYFCVMVAYNHAKSSFEKHHFFAQMVSIAEENHVEVVGVESFRFFDSYKNILLRELAPAMPLSRPMDMAKVCRPELTTGEVSTTLKFLVKNGFLIKDKKGNYKQTNKSVKMPNIGEISPSTKASILDARELAAVELQRQMGQLALSAMDYPKAERDMSGLTLGISRKCYHKVIEELAECRRRIVALVQSDKNVEEVYRLNMQFFPLSNLKSHLDISKNQNKKFKNKILQKEEQ